MKTIALAASVLALAGTILPAALFMAGRMELEAVFNRLSLVGGTLMDCFGRPYLARFRQRSTALVLTVTLALLAAPAAAQDSRGSIGGRVMDSSGGVLPGVTVTIVNNGTNATTVVVTGDGGTVYGAIPDLRQLSRDGRAHRLPDHGPRKGRCACRRSPAGGLHAGTREHLDRDHGGGRSALLMDSGHGDRWAR